MMLSPKQENLEEKLQKIQEDNDLLEKNKELIQEFHRYLEKKDYSIQRRYKYLLRLPKYGHRLDVPFDETTEKDIEKLIFWVKRREDITEATKLDYKVLLKRFYKWLGDGEYPECVKFINTSKKHNNEKLPEDMLTRKDVRKLIEAASHPRDKALIAILWETGARIGEILPLEVGSLEDHKYGMKLVVNGKTGSRRLILIEAVPYINNWLDTHPNRTKNAPLWVNIGTRNNGQAMEYRAILKMLSETAKKAGIEKPVNPHQFRHSRATNLANNFTEAQLCEWFGWVQGSDVPARYVHLSGRDIDAAYGKMYGFEAEEEEEGLDAEFVTCSRCGYENGPAMKYCGRCGMALSYEAAIEAEDKDKQVGISLLQTIQNNPEMAQEMMGRIVETLAEHNPDLAEAMKARDNTD